MNTLGLKNVVRDRGYEALFLLGGAVALSLRPSLKHAFDLESEIGDAILRRRELKSLKQKGLVAFNEGTDDGTVALTKLGQCVLEGGRHPEDAWNRGWDGQWRLIVFDLPRSAGKDRTRFWRWLRSNYFGRFQGSVWVAPDPVPDLAEVARASGFEPSMFLLFTGDIDGKNSARALASKAWDLQSVNHAYSAYQEFAEGVLHQNRSNSLPITRLQEILRDDRKRWWGVVQRDPLLPKELLPKSYKGIRAWKLRQKLHAALMRKIASPYKS